MLNPISMPVWQSVLLAHGCQLRTEDQTLSLQLEPVGESLHCTPTSSGSMLPFNVPVSVGQTVTVIGTATYPATSSMWKRRRRRSDHRSSRSRAYCLSNTNTDVNALPAALVPLVMVVIVLPPLEIAVRPVAWYGPPTSFVRP